MLKAPAFRALSSSLPSLNRHVSPRIPRIRPSLKPPIRHKVTWTQTLHIRYVETPHLRRRLFQIFVYTSCFYVFQRVILGNMPDIEEIPVEDLKAGKKRAKTKPTPDEVLNGTTETEDEDDTLFLPLGPTKREPQRFYKGSDPEWQEFMKLSRDKKRNIAIRQQLVSTIRQQYSQMPQIKQIAGRINTKAGKYWVELQFPDGPSPEYSRSGLEISDDSTKWTTRPVTEQNHLRLNRALYPIATIKALYNTSLVLAKLTWHDLQPYFGLTPKPDIEVARLKKIQAVISMNHRMRYGFSSADSPTTAPTTSSRSTNANQSLTNSSSSATSASAEPPKSILGLLPHPSSLARPTLPSGFMTNVTLMKLLFMHNLLNNKAWALDVHPPKGSVVLTGSIECIGTKGRLTVDVAAAYDVKENTFVEVHHSAKRFVPFRQGPRGGI